MNLLDETKSAISRSKHSTDDVRFVGSRDEKLGIPWSQAEKVLDIDYDDGYGSQEIAADLVVAFTDGGFLRREEYDGSEWWEYEPPFRGPETQKPFGRVKRTYPAYSLEDINYPMEATITRWRQRKNEQSYPLRYVRLPHDQTLERNH